MENWRTYRQLLKANEELKNSQAQIVQAAKMAAIGELAAGVAHEIKNPLQVLLLHLELVGAGATGAKLDRDVQQAGASVWPISPAA